MTNYILTGRLASADADPIQQAVIIDSQTGLIEATLPPEDAPTHKYPVLYAAAPDELVLPGMVDLHIHAREDETGTQNYKEDYQSAADAALNGGVVQVVAMPNTPSPVTDTGRLRWHRNKINALNHPVAISNYVGIGPGSRPLPGRHMYKVYTGPSVGNLFFRSAAELEDTLQHYSGQCVSFHVEDFDELERHKHAETHSLRRPERCVTAALDYLLPLIERFGIRAKLCHWPMAGVTFERIAAHRERMRQRYGSAYATTLEVSPMHLLFDEDMTAADPYLWPLLQMNPALRASSHRKALIKGLQDGFIDFLATDHAPHTLFEKFANFKDVSEAGETPEQAFMRLRRADPDECRRRCLLNGTSGAPWLDTYAFVVCRLVSEFGFSWQQAVACTAKRPGDFLRPFLDTSFGLGYGAIAPGYRAVFTVIDPRRPSRVERSQLKTKSAWSPLEGMTTTGALSRVIIGSKTYSPV